MNPDPSLDPLASSEARLRDAGAGPDCRLALVAEPDPAGAALILAAGRTGSLVSVLNPRWTAPELAWALDHLEPDVVALGPGVILPDGLRGGLPGNARLVRWSHPARSRSLDPGGLGWDLSGRKPGTQRSAEADSAGTRWLLWTSGTTGKPRGIVLPHQAFLASAAAVAARLHLGSGDRWIGSLYPAHVGGLALVLRAGALGASLLLPGAFDPELFSRLVDREGATHASLVPTQLLRVLEERGDRPFPPSFRALLVGGAAAPPSLVERALAAGVPVALTYGMTEATSQVATAPPALVRQRPGTVGPPLDGVELRAGTEADGPAEIRVRGPTVAGALFRGPAADAIPLTDSEGWYATGDLGLLDEGGHLWVTGRLSERIISGGVNVDPAEVEAVLLAHPGVREVAVVGVADPEWGERVLAAVVPADPAAPPTLDDLLDHARPRLLPAKRPRALLILPELPRTPTGKLDRRRLGTEAGSADGPSPSPGRPVS